MQLQTNPAVKGASADKSNGFKLIEATLLLMNELVQLMDQEVDMVNQRRFDEHRDLLKRKQRLTMDYRANMKTIATQPEILKNLPADVLAAVKVSAQKLADISERNAKFLRSAVMATQRLIQSIVSIVKSEVLPKPVYNNPNKKTLEAGLYSPSCKPVAVNRTA